MNSRFYFLNSTFYLIILLSTFYFLLSPFPASAEEFTSTNYKILEPVMFSGSYSSSTGYQLFGAISQISIGTSTAASFSLNAGFLYFPFASSPVVSATAGDGQVSLSWSPSQGFLGWTVSGYNVGQSAISGGPYTYSSSLGNVTSSTRTGLTNGTAYYFVVRPEDAFGNSIATSTEVSATPTGAAVAAAPAGGGGGAVVALPQILFKGLAYPASKITILKDGQIAAVTLAGMDAKFEAGLSGLSSGDYNFGVWAADSTGVRSVIRTFSLSIISGANSVISGIFFPPTISLDKAEVRKGDLLNIFGQTAPSAEVLTAISSDEVLFKKISADENGAWFYKLDTSEMEYGGHAAKARSVAKQDISDFSQLAYFTVSAFNRENPLLKKWVLRGDFNGDNRISLIDFSIAAYWYKRSSPSKTFDLNNDGLVDLADFSIMAYYWTG